MTAPRSTARRIPERRTSGRQEEIPVGDHEPCFLQGRALRAASCSRTRRRARALDRFQVRQSSSRVQRPRSRAAAKHFSRSSSCGNAASRSGTASALSEAAYAASNGRDRKSTRLNSSHGYISYAVFCLKKKKNNERTRLSIRQHINSESEC